MNRAISPNAAKPDVRPSGKRVALIIGVSEYEHAPGLVSPVNDAEDLAKELNRDGFDVDLVVDPDKGEMEESLRGFATRARMASVALFFFSGYGFQVQGRNYLAPIDATLDRIQHVTYDTIDVNVLLSSVSEAKVGVVILDSCHDNTFLKRLAGATGINRGELMQASPVGTLIAMADGGNALCDDNIQDGHGAYVSAILRELRRPGVELRLLLGRVADRVRQSTGSKQQPVVFGDVGGAEVFLNPNL